MITEFISRTIAVSDALLTLDPVQILYRKSEDTTIVVEGYEKLMRAARYLYEQSHTEEPELDFEIRAPRSPFTH